MFGCFQLKHPNIVHAFLFLQQVVELLVGLLTAGCCLLVFINGRLRLRRRFSLPTQCCQTVNINFRLLDDRLLLLCRFWLVRTMQRVQNRLSVFRINQVLRNFTTAVCTSRVDILLTGLFDTFFPTLLYKIGLNQTVFGIEGFVAKAVASIAVIVLILVLISLSVSGGRAGLLKNADGALRPLPP